MTEEQLNCPHCRREHEPPPSITCPDCGATSYHPEDVREGYCGRCHAWTAKKVTTYPPLNRPIATVRTGGLL